MALVELDQVESLSGEPQVLVEELQKMDLGFFCLLFLDEYVHNASDVWR